MCVGHAHECKCSGRPKEGVRCHEKWELQLLMGSLMLIPETELFPGKSALNHDLSPQLLEFLIDTLNYTPTPHPPLPHTFIYMRMQGKLGERVWQEGSREGGIEEKK